MAAQPPKLFNLRRPSLLRANLLIFLSFFAAVWLSGFPHSRPNPLLLLPTLTSIAGTGETIRCIRKRWSFYHAGVLLCIYMDLMAVSLILFFLLYPYAL